MNTASTQEPRLTSLSHGGGCGCKIAPGVLSEILKSVPQLPFPKELLVGIETSDDAAVYQINESQAIVATTDFFMPIVDDPFDFGKIAAKMITNYGFLTMGFRRIEAAVDLDNSASQKLLMSAGYTKEGILRQRVTRSDGSQIDMVELAVLASDWKELD